MYELWDARDHGLDGPRPLIIAENVFGHRRFVFSFRVEDRRLAGEILERLNNGDS